MFQWIFMLFNMFLRFVSQKNKKMRQKCVNILFVIIIVSKFVGES